MPTVIVRGLFVFPSDQRRKRVQFVFRADAVRVMLSPTWYDVFTGDAVSAPLP